MLTVIIPTINRPSLDQAIESVLAQKGERPTIIVVGDGIFPETKYRQEVIEVRSPKTGLAAATRNYGMRYVRPYPSQWVGFLDDDDILAPEYALRLNRVPKGFDVAVFNMDVGEMILPRSQELEWGNIGINFAVRSNAFNRIPFPEVQNGYEEIALLERLSKGGHAIKFIDYTGYIVRPHEIKRKGDKYGL